MPRNFRFVGIIFFILGVLLGIARFKYEFKPDLLDLKMFAFYSSYLESKYMEIIRNNMCEEITGFLVFSGLFLIAFSREAEENYQMNILRLKSFFITAYLNFLFLLTALIFTYGFAFVYMMMVNMCFAMLVYIIVFQTLRFRNRPKQSVQ